MTAANDRLYRAVISITTHWPDREPVHSLEVQSPYETPGAAKAAITRAKGLAMRESRAGGDLLPDIYTPLRVDAEGWMEETGASWERRERPEQSP